MNLESAPANYLTLFSGDGVRELSFTVKNVKSRKDAEKEQA
jgi:hypothetical protein